ncbi:hypothetical protein NP233_g7454 [Leucocoprinus birnbaumii]|uniref:DUF6533 domain-containing protein n=1 Tax=Leucocoprinus birnbaumii TaxID=56174 RepID=A0AAD5VR40_9AGAR|nr:hypothetical protein NP233_g7454 [Leucocoprinus birnbaumii]
MISHIGILTLVLHELSAIDYRQVNCLIFAAFTAATFDRLPTLDSEIALVWNAHWNIIRMLYRLVHILPFPVLFIFLCLQFNYTHSDWACYMVFNLGAVQKASVTAIRGLVTPTIPQKSAKSNRMSTVPSPEALLQEIEKALYIWRQVNILDWFLMLNLEATLIWRSSWNWLKALFLLARYMPFMYLPILFYHQFGSRGLATGEACPAMYSAVTWIFAIGAGIAERRWSYYSDILKPFLMNDFSNDYYSGLDDPNMGDLGTEPGVLAEDRDDRCFDFLIKDDLFPIPGLGIGCFVQALGPMPAAGYILLAVFDAGNLLLMIVRGVSIFRQRGSRSNLSKIVYGNGIIYYFYIFGLSLANALIVFISPDFYLLLIMMEAVIHSVLACRVILNIREHGKMNAAVEYPDYQGNLLGRETEGISYSYGKP